jgi:glycosyltransferase involved in cell wall biosynthesis
MTLRNTIRGVEAAGHLVEVIGPDRFRSIPCPTYPEIRLALRPYPQFSAIARAFAPDAVHIATEGPVGMAARKFCLREKLIFTTAYHTRFPEYVHARIRLPLAFTYEWLRRFHAPARAMMVATEAIRADLERRRFRNLVMWTRGVDTELFRPGVPLDNDWERPVFMYVGRVAVEKNIAAFLALDLPGTKVVVGDGPQREELQQRFPSVVFTGAKMGEELAAHFRSADVFVFPSRTDTFGLVLLEAMASGTPAAAFPVAGPIDVIDPGRSGMLNEDLRAAALAALELNRVEVRRHALGFSWDRATAQFLANLQPNHASA